MAMEMYVLSDKELNSVAEWQAAIDAEGYPLRLAGDVELKTQAGFLPANLHEVLTGFECGHFPANEFMAEVQEEMPDIDFGHDWKFVLTFRWMGDFNELQAAWMAGTAYAVVTSGVVFDDQEGRVRTASEARQVVRDIERDMPKVEAIMRDLGKS